MTWTAAVETAVLSLQGDLIKVRQSYAEAVLQQV